VRGNYQEGLDKAQSALERRPRIHAVEGVASSNRLMAENMTRTPQVIIDEAL